MPPYFILPSLKYYVFTPEREQGPSRSSSVELFAIAVSFWQSQTPGEFEYMLQKFRYEGGALGITSPVFSYVQLQLLRKGLFQQPLRRI